MVEWRGYRGNNKNERALKVIYINSAEINKYSYKSMQSKEKKAV